jgi:adenylate cyclase
LPFGNPGHAREDDLLANVIPESIRHRLAGLAGLRLVAHESSLLHLNGQSGESRAIGRRLGARYLVQGTVQHLESHLRVTAQLVDTLDGSHLWSLRVDRTAVDVFVLEDDVAQQVACAVCRSLLGTAPVDATELSVAPQDGLNV